MRNMAEGAGRWSEADSAKHYVKPERNERGIHLLEGVVAMLTKMV